MWMPATAIHDRQGQPIRPIIRRNGVPVPADRPAGDWPADPARPRTLPGVSGATSTVLALPPRSIDAQVDSTATAPTDARPTQPPSSAPPSQRWTLSSWLFVRPEALGVSPPTPLAPDQAQLGGTQAGARAALRLDRHNRWEAHARLVTSGSNLSGIEAAAGLTWQPLERVPLRLSVERREPIVGNGGRSAFAAFASGGVSDVALPGRFRLDGYGAAGVVGRNSRDLFAEGSTTVRRPLIQTGAVTIDGGGGLWAAAQPGVTRVDAGPSLRIRLATGTVQPVLSIDWRQRLAGDAAPASGIAITLASDF